MSFESTSLIARQRICFNVKRRTSHAAHIRCEAAIKNARCLQAPSAKWLHFVAKYFILVFWSKTIVLTTAFAKSECKLQIFFCTALTLAHSLLEHAAAAYFFVTRKQRLAMRPAEIFDCSLSEYFPLFYIFSWNFPFCRILKLVNLMPFFHYFYHPIFVATQKHHT